MYLTSPEPALPTITEPNSLINRLEDEIKQNTGIFSTSPTKKIPVSVDDDLFASMKTADPMKAAADDDDLFAPATSTKPKKGASDLFGSSPPSKKPSKSAPAAAGNVFDEPPEDIFASASSSRQAAIGADDIFASSKDNKPKKQLDDLFSSTKKSAKTNGVLEETDAGKVRNKLSGPLH